ncbi:MAG: UDP-N-acetylglucosamine 1-carboxyvinyltransferase [Deltaproteobacteria bacterium]|nr:UDP-N-acetylglucosamine 1-carboxyvinyltransferase [Deltaproteobacteria bacterium]
MDAFRIQGGRPLRGEISVSGSKNASLPIMVAALLAEGESVLFGAPDLVDVRTLGQLLAHMGAGVRREGRETKIDATRIDKHEAPYDLVRTMRASFLVIGPLLARFGRARVSLPGGCAIGARPVDQHLKALEALGATLHISHGYVEAETKGLCGAEITFDFPTVGGTENLMIAASLAKGQTVLNNAACEPEIVDLALALGEMGVRIEGAGTERLVVHGTDKVRPYRHQVVCDRIEFGTFLVAGALAGEPLTILGGVADHQAALVDKLKKSGADIAIDGPRATVTRAGAIRPVDLRTAPYPGFPTDMQAQLMALMTVADGVSVITETIFENRFMHVPELNRLGADIRVDGGKAVVHGVKTLSGSTVMATDLRASAGLVLAGLVAEGETVVRRIYHLDRGYEHLADKLIAVGANIQRFRE